MVGLVMFGNIDEEVAQISILLQIGVMDSGGRVEYIKLKNNSKNIQGNYMIYSKDIRRNFDE